MKSCIKLVPCAISLLKTIRLIALYTTVSHFLSLREAGNWYDYVIKRNVIKYSICFKPTKYIDWELTISRFFALDIITTEITSYFHSIRQKSWIVFSNGACVNIKASRCW